MKKKNEKLFIYSHVASAGSYDIFTSFEHKTIKIKTDLTLYHDDLFYIHIDFLSLSHTFYMIFMRIMKILYLFDKMNYFTRWFPFEDTRSNEKREWEKWCTHELPSQNDTTVFWVEKLQHVMQKCLKWTVEAIVKSSKNCRLMTWWEWSAHE